MTLRTRLLAALLLVVVALGVAGVVVFRGQRDYLFDQLDERLEAFRSTGPGIFGRLSGRAGGPSGVPARGPTSGPTGTVAPFSDVYAGRVGSDGRLETVLTPDGDPQLRPDVTNVDQLTAPTTRATTAGKAERVRILSARLPDGTLAVFAISTARAEGAARRLVTAIVIAGLIVAVIMAFVVWWVIRLGLRPIREMTDAADAISAGAVDRRVEVPAGKTEASRLGVALNTMIDTSQASEARLRRFVADASHELRTPLTTLRGYTSLYAAGGLADDAAVSDGMRRMNSEATRMAQIVEDLLLLAELDEHGARVHESIDLVPILQDTVADMRVVQPQRRIELDVPDQLPIIGDADQIVQVIGALTTNAMRYTPVDTKVTIRALHQPETTRVEVVDHGPGIVAGDEDRVFDRFYRADPSRTRESGGNGLGLAIVASIVVAHGGRYGVVATSEAGGATFWFEIPAAGSSPRPSGPIPDE